jgi:Ser/Thr protein kinase RdoA (MazF antagonist)
MMRLSVMHAVVETLSEAGTSPLADQAAVLWTREPVSPRYLRTSANVVFTFTHAGRSYVLRLTDAHERTQAMLQGEVDYINHLALHGVPVARPIRSLAGLEVERVQTPLGTFHAVVFDFIKGTQYDIEELEQTQFAQWGHALGQLHRAAQSYRGPGRATWQERLTALEHDLPPNEQAARKLLARVAAQVEQFAADEQSFGLLHGDFELDNLIWTEQTIGIVDFDESTWGWFVADIAFALRDLFGDSAGNIDWESADLRTFLDGYRSANAVSADTLAHLPVFLDMHNLYMFAKLLKTLDIPESEAVPAWVSGLQQKLIDKLHFYRDLFASRESSQPSAL